MIIRPGWLRARRMWAAVAAVVLVLVIAGVAVLSWPRGGSGSGRETASSSAASPSVAGGSAQQRGADPERASAASAAGDAAAMPPSPELTKQVPGVPVGGVQRQLVRTAQVTVSVDETTGAVRQVRTTAAAAGAQIVEEQSSDGGSWLTLRVPAEALDRVIDDIGLIGRVTARSTQVVDSTEEVVDLDARVASQQASVARVRTLLAQAADIADVVAIESELSRREADLDSLTGRLASLRSQVALSTLTVDLRGPTAPPVTGDDQPPGFIDGLETGWNGLRALGTAVAAVIGFSLPFLPVLAVLLGLGLLTRRLLASRRVAASAAGTGPGGPAAGS